MTTSEMRTSTRRRRIFASVGTVLLILLAALLGSVGTAQAATPAVWIGSPMTATWPNADGCAGAAYPSPDCSLPSVHHIVYNPGTDWGADLQNVAPGTGVFLYAAPQTPGMEITARVELVRPACGSLVIAHGGSRVTIGLYNGGTKIGTVTYAHIEPSVQEGWVISRWGSQLGVVGNYTAGGCWGGPHVHVEMYSEQNYACYNRGWRPGQQMNPTNFMGFIGGSYASGPRQACP